ncbi:TDT family transporter [Curtobacterium sp. MCBD17_034]|uniref:SLAC1 family transporter n=1 Tax=unclassified Curtobacterium TaxID=257496 RepID=UPI000DA81770|nr:MULTISPECIES: TDT family transporter [unclassified Curtobacterium]PZF62112.1 TDT family transporter [Curtobacterium sp. MCBD17_034]PZM33953.1 TDT family transporter [Curtobacterium sp. MCBD17_031]
MTRIEPVPRHIGRRSLDLTLNVFGIPLGLAGLGGAWTAATALTGAPAWPDEVFFAVATLLWVVFGVVYLVQGSRRRGRFRADLHHPTDGPFASFVPLVGVLLSAHNAPRLGAAGPVLCWVFIIGLALVAARLTAHWLEGGVSTTDVHPGFFVPVVAGPFVASIALGTIGEPELAICAFGVGLFFWAIIGAVAVQRLMSGSGLPDGALPTLTAFLASPSTASIAWIGLHHGELDQVQLALTGVFMLMVLVQVMLIPRYVRLRSSMSFWVFTFPAASATNYGVRLSAALHGPAWATAAWIILTVGTIVVLGVAGGTLWVLVMAVARRPTSRRSTAHEPQQVHRL